MQDSGMSLRDWFAGQALAGICAPVPDDDSIDEWDYDKLAKGAYSMADAMLATRAKGTP